MSEPITESIEASPHKKEEILTGQGFTGRSEVIQEILSRKPSFIEQWSLLVFLGLILLLIAGTWFVKYPDIVEGQATLTGENSPKEIIPQQTGKLIALFAKNNQNVKEGEVLGWLESSADMKEVIDLSEKLTKAMNTSGKENPRSISGLFSQRYIRLGELQASYQTFITAWQQYNDYLVNGFYSRKRDMLNSDIISLNKIIAQTSAQKGLTQKDNELAQKSFEMNEMLFREKVISAEEYRQAKRKLLDNEKAIPQADVSIISRQDQIRDKHKEIDQLDHDFLQQQTLFEQALYTLKSNVDDWLRKFTLQAPTDGQVIFILPLQQKQYITKDKLLGYVNPTDSKLFAEVRLSQRNFGKLSTGMRVQLRFEAYPYQEVGYVGGRLDYISKVAFENEFIGTVRLDKGLTTNQGITLQYKNGLKAQAIIITKDMRLLERLYYTTMKMGTITK